MKKANKRDTRKDVERRAVQAARTKRRRAARDKLAILKATKLYKENIKLIEENVKLKSDLAALQPAPQEAANGEAQTQSE